MWQETTTATTIIICQRFWILYICPSFDPCQVQGQTHEKKRNSEMHESWEVLGIFHPCCLQWIGSLKVSFLLCLFVSCVVGRTRTHWMIDVGTKQTLRAGRRYRVASINQFSIQDSVLESYQAAESIGCTSYDEPVDAETNDQQNISAWFQRCVVATNARNRVHD